MPHFYEGGREQADANKLVDEWLEKRGLAQLNFPFFAGDDHKESLQGLLSTMARWNPDSSIFWAALLVLDAATPSSVQTTRSSTIPHK